MGLEKAIAAGKEHRRPYKGAKAFDHSCRNHGNNGHGPSHECPWCKSNRLHSNKVRQLKAEYTPNEKILIDDYKSGVPEWWIMEFDYSK